jgi:hypothetical protein
MLLSPATAPPPRALKKVIALVIAASIRAFSQSNFCSSAWVILFVQCSMKPLVVNVGILLLILFIQLKYLLLIFSVGFFKECATEDSYSFVKLISKTKYFPKSEFLEHRVLVKLFLNEDVTSGCRFSLN